jgi:hypothetical protein
MDYNQGVCTALNGCGWVKEDGGQIMKSAVKRVLAVLLGLGVWAFVLIPLYPTLVDSMNNFLVASNMSTITFPIKSYEKVTTNVTRTYTTTTVIDSNTTETNTVTEVSPTTTWDWVEHPQAVDISGLTWFILGVVMIGLPIFLLASLFRHYRNNGTAEAW